jgi:hypothetical protein
MRHILLFLVMWLSSMCYGIQFSIHTVFFTESFLCQHLCFSISNSAKYMECDMLKFIGATLNATDTVPNSGLPLDCSLAQEAGYSERICWDSLLTLRRARSCEVGIKDLMT